MIFGNCCHFLKHIRTHTYTYTHTPYAHSKYRVFRGKFICWNEKYDINYSLQLLWFHYCAYMNIRLCTHNSTWYLWHLYFCLVKKWAFWTWIWQHLSKERRYTIFNTQWRHSLLEQVSWSHHEIRRRIFHDLPWRWLAHDLEVPMKVKMTAVSVLFVSVYLCRGDVNGEAG